MSSMATNRLLDALDGLLGADAKAVEFASGEVIARAGDHISKVTFPTSGLVACTIATSSGAEIETALVGYQDVLGGAAILGGRTFLCDSVACLPTSAVQVSSKLLADLSVELPDLRSLIFARERFTYLQAQHAAACNACHSIRQRLASWLLRAADASGSSELSLTQERVAGLIGVQRASVSVEAHHFQRYGLIDYMRGRIWIRDFVGLEGESCGCAAALREKRPDFTAPEGEFARIPFHSLYREIPAPEQAGEEPGAIP